MSEIKVPLEPREWTSYCQEGVARGFLHSVCFDPDNDNKHECLVMICDENGGEASVKAKADAIVSEHNALVRAYTSLRSRLERVEADLREAVNVVENFCDVGCISHPDDGENVLTYTETPFALLKKHGIERCALDVSTSSASDRVVIEGSVTGCHAATHFAKHTARTDKGVLFFFDVPNGDAFKVGQRVTILAGKE